MRIAGLQKLTLLDYPGKTAATVFTPGCNFRCPFCHNADLVTGGAAHETTAGASASADAISLDEFFAFLSKRQGLLDGVCISGGEPLLQPGIEDFCARVRELGYTVKLDTNGSFPDRLRALVKAGLVDCVAMDVKNAPERYAETVGVPAFDLAPVQASLDFLLTGTVPYEVRTTVVRELHTADDLHALAAWVQGVQAWHLQSFIDAESVLGGTGRFHAWDPDDLRALLPELQRLVPTVALRGVE
ncbi:anaerobic ribonucleoside-triphosphate reductase activating protein [Eggerthella timonensis]|uniref:anaerobic ribonucleoside-triphosphate reductase activating protein n=1 Tax=Eggerthella timonensis TaxID=1871008 RepID=UPI000C7658B8|nr:anaerobic ribonucleoside-triphosphate reductase activating protein [Eggerthella timonensis]